MPLVRIDLRKGKDTTYRDEIGLIVHDALISLGVPKDDHFQDGLAGKPGLRREDVFVSLVEVRRENWSFGNGIAQYA